MDFSNIAKVLEERFVQSEKDWVDIDLSPSGLMNITLVSRYFRGKNMEERRSLVLDLLPPEMKGRLGFLSLYSVEEAEVLELAAPQKPANLVHSWFDLANAAVNKEKYAMAGKTSDFPRTVSFYSFKGGVGRSTALSHVAWILAMKGRKVLVIDLDLEAPGLHMVFPELIPFPKYGIVDYFYERCYAPDGQYRIHVADLLGEVPVENASGRVFVIPAGKVSLEYIAKVDDLKAVSLRNYNLWEQFVGEVTRHIRPDLILADSRTGINEWGAFSLLRIADDVVYFLYPNEENLQAAETILRALREVDGPNVHLVFSKIPNSKVGNELVREAWSRLKPLANGTEDDLDEEGHEEPMMIDYHQDIAISNHYPVEHLLPVFAPVANLIDEEAERNQLKNILSGADRRRLIQSLTFAAVDGIDEKHDLGKVFQRTSGFDKFIDDTTCVIRGQKGTGKTALYWMMLKHGEQVRKWAKGRLDQVEGISAHGSYRPRPGREEFRHWSVEIGRWGAWEAFWRGYAFLRLYLEGKATLRKAKYKPLREAFNGIPRNAPNRPWTQAHTELLRKFATDADLSRLIKEAMSDLNEQLQKKGTILWLLYDALEEDIPEDGNVRHDALSGLFSLILASDAQRLSQIRFKVLIREDIWESLHFANKSHFSGRDVLLKWSRADLLRLALRQALQSREYAELLNRHVPVPDPDTCSEEDLLASLQILWGIRRGSNGRSKTVARWVYERLTDATGTAFPRSLGILLQAAREHELQVEDQSRITVPADRLLSIQSLNHGLMKASVERCRELRQGYPELEPVFDRLSNMSNLCGEEEIRDLYGSVKIPSIDSYEGFVQKLKGIGLLAEEGKRKDKKIQYRFAELYVHGFAMKRKTEKF